jgi:hypothetical protein
MKYSVTLLYDVSETVEVEADSVDEAIDLAYGNANASLCHQCANELDFGEAYDEIVYDEAGNVVKDARR